MMLFSIYPVIILGEITIFTEINLKFPVLSKFYRQLTMAVNCCQNKTSLLEIRIVTD